jgi:hypothetical protein
MRDKTIYIFFIVLIITIVSCKPINSAPPSYIKNIGVYKEGYDAIAVYIILADSSGIITASNGTVTLNVSLNKNFLSEQPESQSVHIDPVLMDLLQRKKTFNNLLEKLVRKIITEEMDATIRKGNTRTHEEIRQQIDKNNSKEFKRIDLLRVTIADSERNVLSKYKTMGGIIPKEYFPLFTDGKSIYLKFIGVKREDFKLTKIGSGSFEKEALVYIIGQ